MLNENNRGLKNTEKSDFFRTMIKSQMKKSQSGNVGTDEIHLYSKGELFA